VTEAKVMVASRPAAGEPARAAQIEFRDVAHGFASDHSKVLALAGINLTVHKGEFVAVVGPSGCGKTTLLNLVSHMVEPRRGQVLVDGRIADDSVDTAYMLANDALLPWRTARANVELGLEVRRVPRAQRRALSETWLRRMGLAEYADADVRSLSQGMRQRVAIARTLVQEPACILMDEPFSALDAQTRVAVQEQFLTQWEQVRPTVILVTHDLGEAILLADRVVLMSARPSRIIADIEVGLPRPRDPIRDREAEGFLELNRELWERLREQNPDFIDGDPL
jgi:NitT/TauT family transport system ATP-binding protein